MNIKAFTRSFSALLASAGALIGSDAGPTQGAVAPNIADVLPQTESIVLPSRAFRQQAKDVVAMLASVDECFSGQVVRLEREYWPASDPQIDVFSIFVIRVDKSLQGTVAPGAEARLMVRGGRMARWGNPSPGGSFKPSSAAQSVLVQYADQPFPTVGQAEFLCATRFDAWAADVGVVFVPSSDARFAIAGTQLTTLVPAVESSPGVSQALLGRPVDVAWRLLESGRAVAQAAAEGP